MNIFLKIFDPLAICMWCQCGIVTTSAIIGAAAAVKGTMDANKNAKAANKIAEDAANRPAPVVDINALDAQAREFSRRNAADSAALEAEYNPGAARLRTESLDALLASLPRNARTQALADRVAAQAGTRPNAAGYDSPLLRDAIAKAKSDLALGGQLPLDVRNLVVRGALARSGQTTGGLNLGRDLSVRDLGLTSLDLEQKRLAAASAIGAQEAALGQGNANLNFQADVAGTNNLFNSANFLSTLDNGEFARQFAVAQLGQNIAQPLTGLDPSSVVNLAVGNKNATATAQQQADALRIAAANQAALQGGQLAGLGVGALANYYGGATTPSTYSYVPPTTYTPNAAGMGVGAGLGVY